MRRLATHGDPPSAPAVQYVDATYVGVSDGSATKPHRRIADAVSAASTTGPTLIAIAAGTYDESLVLDRPVRLWGRCPTGAGAVEIRGLPGTAAVRATSAVEIDRIAITSALAGLEVGAGRAKLVDVLVHDAGTEGIHVGPGDAELVAEHTLIEAATTTGVVIEGAKATLDRVVVRGTRGSSSGLDGAGIEARGSAAKVRASLTLRRSVVERTLVTGIDIGAAEATLEEVLVRDIAPRKSDGLFGRGIDVTSDAALLLPAEITIRESVIERATTSGINLFSARAAIVDTTIRDTRANAKKELGRGISIAAGPGFPGVSDATIQRSAVLMSREFGIACFGSRAVIESSVVKDTLGRDSDGQYGMGILVTSDARSTRAPELTVRTSLVVHNRNDGISAVGATATIESTVVRDTQPQRSDGRFGRGIGALVDTTTKRGGAVVVRRCVVQDNYGSGINLAGSSATVEDTVIIGTRRSGGTDGGLGRGIDADFDKASKLPSSVTVRRSVVDGNHDTGIIGFGATMVIESTVVRGTRHSKVEEPYGRGVFAAVAEANGSASTLELRDSLIDDNEDIGLIVYGSSANVERTILRKTIPGTASVSGVGASVSDHPASTASVSISDSLFESNRTVGLLLSGSAALVERCVFRDTALSGDGDLGCGILMQIDPTTNRSEPSVIRSTVVLASHESGIAVFGTSAEISETYVDGTLADAQGLYGDGIFVAGGWLPESPGRDASVVLRSSVVTNNARAGAGVFGARIEISGTTAQCNAFDLDVEVAVSSDATRPPAPIDGGGNFCGCGSKAVCKAETQGLAPASPPERVIGPT